MYEYPLKKLTIYEKTSPGDASFERHLTVAPYLAAKSRENAKQ
jgi:hypothetical protein